MNVLLIGGTGQISLGIVKALKKRGAKITAFNRGKTDDLMGDGVERVHGDRNEPGAFQKALGNRTFDAVIDMICFNAPQAAAGIEFFAGKTAHFIFTSTVCSYGNTQTELPTPETAVQHPHSTYGKDKLTCEQMFLKAHAEKKFAVTILRPSHTFGPGGGIINNLGWAPTFVDRLRKGKPIIVSGDGYGLWQSAFTEDVGVGYAYACGRAKCFGEAYNIVGDPVVTWDQYTQNTAAALGAPKPKIVHIPTDLLLSIAPKRYSPLDEIFQYHGVYSNEKIYRDIPEYKPKTPYADAVRATVAFMEQHGRIANSDTDTVEDQIIAAYEAFASGLKGKIHAE